MGSPAVATKLIPAAPASPQSPLLPSAIPAHRSHDAVNNLKRSDPFQFGSRYLLEEDDVFEFNAWDHVETDDAYKEYAEAQYARQRDSPVSDFDRKRFNADPAKWWDLFYKNNTSNFFKDRKWLQQEFPVLHALTRADAGPRVLLEVGAGAGNTIFPLLAQNENRLLTIHACDFSRRAIDVIRADARFQPDLVCGHVWDIADPRLPAGLGPGTVDVAVLVFVFSALAPDQWRAAVRNVHRVLRPGGEVLFRDYGRGDLAQVRFKKGRYLDENFYVRGDGTRVYFFEAAELRRIWGGTGAGERAAKEEDGPMSNCQPQPREGAADMASRPRADQADGQDRDLDGFDTTSQPLCTDGAADTASRLCADKADDQDHDNLEGFEISNLDVDKRLLVNRQRKLKMYRAWIQGRFRKRSDLVEEGIAAVAEKKEPTEESSPSFKSSGGAPPDSSS
ncbi:MAG: hypothetical protein M1826_004754 [Phylliscum demangeonii]|nr:MAG: hypothetical protein M1826_004754 [Phylliscum demangeonii]